MTVIVKVDRNGLARPAMPWGEYLRDEKRRAELRALIAKCFKRLSDTEETKE